MAQLFAEAGLDGTNELTDHFSNTKQRNTVDQPCKKAINTVTVELNTLGDAILKAISGLSNPEVHTEYLQSCFTLLCMLHMGISIQAQV